NANTYNKYYDGLYAVENAMLVGALVFAVRTSSGGWRRLYLHLLAAFAVYAVDSQLVDRATANGSYYSGSLYDVPLIWTLAWPAAASLSARGWELNKVQSRFDPRWGKVVPRVAMI